MNIKGAVNEVNRSGTCVCQPRPFIIIYYNLFIRMISHTPFLQTPPSTKCMPKDDQRPLQLEMRQKSNSTHSIFTVYKSESKCNSDAFSVPFHKVPKFPSSHKF